MTDHGRTSILAVLLVIAAGHLSLFPKVADLDGFYHIGHALAYLEGSIFDTSLPWATQSVIREHGADLWWGFHMLLLPFAWIGGVEGGIRLAAVALTGVFSGAFYWVLRRHGVQGAGWWTALFLIAVPNLFLRYLMVRPHMISLAASVVLLSFLARGRWWQAGLVAALITWVHVSLFWMAPGVVAAYTLIRVTQRLLRGSTPEFDSRSVPVLSAIPAVLLGTVAGWLLRPHPLATGELANVQIIRLFAEKSSEEPLLFAAELQPLTLTDIALTSWLFLAAWIVACLAVGLFAWNGRLDELRNEDRTFLLGALLISLPFFGLARLSARRAMMEWAAFGFLLLPLLWGLVRAEERTRLRPLLLLLLVGHLGWGVWRHQLNLRFVAFEGDTMRGVAEYLDEHAVQGDVVWHAKWDNFGPLFARNRTARYLGGMDPIFQFAYSPRRYWEYFYLSADVNREWTCDAYPCQLGVATDTHYVLREHFNARWVVVEPRRNPRLSLYFLEDPRYELAAETQREAIFEILPGEPSP